MEVMKSDESCSVRETEVVEKKIELASKESLMRQTQAQAQAQT